MEFPLTLQDDDRWFYDEDELLEYCEEHELDASNLLLRIGKRIVPSTFEPSDYWCDDIAEDDDPTEFDGDCQDMADMINAWAKENIITYEMGPYRPQVES